VEEVVSVELNYVEICALLESGTVERGTKLYEKLRAARDAFRKTPKVYGNGLGIRVKARLRDNMDAITYNDPKDLF
jgi:hypothetical protein